MKSALTLLGKTTFRNHDTTFGIRQVDRLYHTYILGKTGTGKSTLLDSLVRQDILAARGCCLIDPHGDLVESIMAWVPQERKENIIYFDVTDDENTWGYNPIRSTNEKYRSLVASGVLEVFKKLWGDGKNWGVNMEHILRNTLHTLLEQECATLEDIPRILTDKSYRKEAVGRVTNETVHAFWQYEYEAYSKLARTTAIAPILNKVGALLTDPTLRRVLVSPKQELHLRPFMDDGKVILINLAKGKIGEDATHLCGGLFLTFLGLAGMSRANLPAEKRESFFVYVDEMQNFTTRSVASMLSELRKYGVGVIGASQYLDALSPEIRESLLGNVGTLISFRVGPNDARYLAREFAPTLSETDLLHLPRFNMYLRLMIDGEASKPFSARTVQFQSP